MLMFSFSRGQTIARADSPVTDCSVVHTASLPGTGVYLMTAEQQVAAGSLLGGGNFTLASFVV
jgi:hypothetical protein